MPTSNHVSSRSETTPESSSRTEHDGGGPHGEKQTAGNPKDVLAMTSGRLDITLFPQTAIIYGALAMTEGDAKYGGYNYRLAGVRVSVYVAAILRHLFKFFNGEWEDPKTKVPHLGSVIACVAVLIDSWEQGNVIDDRPLRSPVARLLDRCQDVVRHLYTIFPGGPGRVTELKHGAKDEDQMS
jgi:hypothetical protein